MPNGKPVTNDKIYDLIGRVESKQDSIRLELKADIVAAVSAVSQSQGRLEAKFDTLEAGRLTRNEQKTTDIELRLQKFEGQVNVKDAVISSRVAIIWAIGGGLAIIGSEIVLNVLLRSK